MSLFGLFGPRRDPNDPGVFGQGSATDSTGDGMNPNVYATGPSGPYGAQDARAQRETEWSMMWNKARRIRENRAEHQQQMQQANPLDASYAQGVATGQPASAVDWYSMQKEIYG
jgi:hypothetical protein